MRRDRDLLDRSRSKAVREKGSGGGVEDCLSLDGIDRALRTRKGFA
ncbi:hypothetical protein K9B35_01045 [Sphingomonas sp. R647]|nr:hypothetical protein [Sphingomonas sp. R647]MCA1196544.1 hypothetical protein [Sphingomonas sp. R647]